MGGILSNIFGIIDSGRAAKAVSDADIAAEHGVLEAVSSGQQDIQSALSQGRNGLQTATGQAVRGDTTLNSPYLAAGKQGLANLESFAKSPASKFSFNLNDYFNSPAYQFQLAQGTNAIQNANAATGAGAGGAALKELTKFSQGLASDYYGQAYDQALRGFGANEQATLANNAELIGAGNAGANRQQTAQGIPVETQALLAQLGLSGNEAMAGLGLQGAKMAGDYATNAGMAHAGGIISQGNAWAGLGGDILGMAGGMFGPAGPEWMPDIGSLGSIFGSH